MRQNYLQEKVIAAEKSLTDLQLTTARLDDRIIQARKFIEDDEFIKTAEFKSFLYKVRQNELTLALKPRESKEKTRELVEKLLAYDPESEEMTPTEARDFVQTSGMFLIPS